MTLLGKRERRKLANNTYLETDGYRDGDGKLHGDIHVMFHKTAIITYYENGGYRLDTGGWRTKTTQERMNRFLPAWITVAGEWESNGGWGGYRDASNWLAYIRRGYEKDKVGQSNWIRPYFHRTI